MQTFEANRPRDPRRSRPAGWAGYGPRGVLMRGDSGLWHLLAHLDELRVSPGQAVSEGETVGVGSAVHHVHWEVRSVARPPAGAAVVEITNDPSAWLRGELVPWSGQCPEAPGDTRDTPRSCRPGRRQEGGGGGTTPGPTVRSATDEALDRLHEAARAEREVWDGWHW